jgi:stress response protein YsnF
LKKEKITRSKKPARKKVPDSENASPAGILLTKNSGDEVVVNKSQFLLEETIVSPELPKSTVTIIRPTTIQKEESLATKAADLMESVKDKTEEMFDSIKSATGQGVKKTVSDLNGSDPLVITIIEQKYSSDTKTYAEEIAIEKRQVERNKNIEVKVAYDEIFVNGKEIGSSVGDTFRGIKDKILEVVSFEKDRDERELETMKGDTMPLLENSSETEKMIPLYAEEVVISKRMVKVAELIIRKRKVTETSKLAIDLISEELTVQNPTGRGESSENDE